MIVKICGITHPLDGEMAARYGADYIGLIFTDKSTRKVTPSLAQEIASAARKAGVEPVGVFVDENFEEIQDICEQTGLRVVQLHGTISRQAFSRLPECLKVIYAVSAAEAQLAPDSATILCDSVRGGSGVPFDWTKFRAPQREWYLAGGLNPNNVAEAIKLLKPAGVDVSSGVEFPLITRKDPELVKAFIRAAKQRKNNI